MDFSSNFETNLFAIKACSLEFDPFELLLNNLQVFLF